MLPLFMHEIGASSGPTPYTGEWVSILDDGYWQSINWGVWDGSKWDAQDTGSYYRCSLYTKPVPYGEEGNSFFWPVGYQPTLMRITSTQNGSTVNFIDMSERQILYDTDYDSLKESSLSYYDSDSIMYLLDIRNNNPFSITNIEFFEFWQSIFDNTKWTSEGEFGLGTWNGAAWESEYFESGPPMNYSGYGVSLDVVGDWPEGFRPSKMRVTAEGPGVSHEDFYVAVSDSEYNYIVDSWEVSIPYVNGTILYTSFMEATDIITIDIGNVGPSGTGEAFTVTNIEFF
jgi:hypothetical protein